MALILASWCCDCLAQTEILHQESTDGAFISVSEPGSVGTSMVGNGLPNAATASAYDTYPNEYIVIHRSPSIIKAVEAELQIANALGVEGPTFLAHLVLVTRVNAEAAIATEQEAFSEQLYSLGLQPRSVIAGQLSLSANATLLHGIQGNDVGRLLAAGINVRPARKLSLFLSESVPLIGADQVWSHSDGTGHAITGSGVRVGVIDTGIDWTHPAFGSCTDSQFQAGTCSRVPAGRNLLAPSTLPKDDNGHGTHVSGIIGGGGVLPGVAPGVSLHALKVCNASAQCSESAILQALEYSADPNGDLDFADHLDVVNLSLGGPGDPDDLLSQTVDAMVGIGVVAVIAGGNSGPGPETIGSPGTARQAITVAASYPRSMSGSFYGSIDPVVDQVAEFSSRGPVIWAQESLRIEKPDITAPGVKICAPRASILADNQQYPCPSGYIAMSGTSMATPHVAGAAALVKQAHPDWTPRQIKNALLEDADVLTNPSTGQPYSRAEQGAGRLDARNSALRLNAPLIAEINLETNIAFGVVSVSGSAFGPGFSGYSLAVRAQGESTWRAVSSSTIPVDRGVLGAFNSDDLPQGTHDIRLTVTSGTSSHFAFSSFLTRRIHIASPIDLATTNCFFIKECHSFNVDDPIVVTGAARGGDFARFDIDVCTVPEGNCSTAGVTLAGGGSAPVSGELGRIVLHSHPGVRTGLFDIVLKRTDTLGRVDRKSSRIYADTTILSGYPVPFDDGEVNPAISLALEEQPILHDINGDGRAEIIYSYVDKVQVRDRNFQQLPGWPFSPTGFLSQRPPSVADLDGDGDKELIVASTFEGFALHANGSLLPGFPFRVLHPENGGVFADFYSTYINTFVTRDLNQDGKSEIISPTLIGYRSDGEFFDGWRPESTPHMEIEGPAEGPAIGDINFDGVTEVVTATNWDGGDHLMVFGPAGQLLWSRPLRGKTPSGPILADVNLDGKKDVVLKTLLDSSTLVYAFDGSGAVLPGWPVELVGARHSGKVPSPSVADLDLDGLPDIVVGTDRYIYVLRQDGSVRSKMLFDTVGGPITIANVDATPDLEIVPGYLWETQRLSVASSFYILPAYKVDFSLAAGFPKRLTSYPMSEHIPVADLDGDGKNDMIGVYNYQLYAWRTEGAVAEAGEWPMHGGSATHARTVGIQYDEDEDTVRDNVDNCRLKFNPEQDDGEHDGIGDVCDDDADNDGFLNSVDFDDDNDGLTDVEEVRRGTSSLNGDSDRDGVSDGQELSDGTDPLDRGSMLVTLNTEICNEWNGFLGGMWNFLEHVNMSQHPLNVVTTLYSFEGQPISTRSFALEPGAQFDVPVHSMNGWTPNLYGKVCSRHDGAPGDIDGRMVYYKPDPAAPGRFQFAFAMPMANGKRGRQYVPFNTYHPGSSSNLAANWIQISNMDSGLVEGTLRFYAQNGAMLRSRRISVAPGARSDQAAHELGSGIVGLVEWIPDNANSLVLLRNVRYLYDNPGSRDSFDTAFQLEAGYGSGAQMSVPLNTVNRWSILELVNTSDQAQQVAVNIYGGLSDGQARTIELGPKSSFHLITDPILGANQMGVAVVRASAPDSLLAVAMLYGWSSEGKLLYMYGIPATEAIGSVLRGSYNTYLDQDSWLVIHNSSELSRRLSISGFADLLEPVISPHSAISLHLNQRTSTNRYGLLTIQADGDTGIGAWIFRSREPDYVFPTTVR